MPSTDRYLFRQLTAPFLYVTLALTGVVWLAQSLRFVDLIVNRGLSTATFFYLMMLMLPTFLAVILPVALFIAVIFTYHRLTMDSEMVVLRAVGVGPVALARPVLLLATVVLIVNYAVALYLMPASYRTFKDLQVSLRSDLSSVLLHEGVFNTLTPDLTVYVRERGSDGVLRGVLVHDAREPSRPISMMAERGAVVQTETGPRFVLVNGNRQEVRKPDGQLSLLYFERYTLDLGDFVELPRDRWREPRERFLHELFHPGDSADDRLQSRRLITEGHQRLAGPLGNLVLALVGVAATIGGTFNRRGQTQRLVVGTAAGLAYLGLGISLTGLVMNYPAMLPLLYLLPIGAASVAGYIMLRSGTHPPVPAMASARP
ncbi:MAG: LPS export ABC transporter permease LptF [Alphaproteobacteria bacterium]|nr:LPS export ABC transporter permease LptF [Alphaproteobacteria bacterium]